ncbi:xylulokinase [Neomoorella thermoacetica]|uniref:xylulokinase n=1 Tax=Neomoorella thermoacetica TaxID=1525 RepID=UPI0030CD5E99
MKKPLLIGIDAGTSSVKICIFNINGELVRQGEVKIAFSSPRPGWIELDLKQYWDATCRVLREITTDLTGFAGLGFSVTSPTTVFLDDEGLPVRPAIPYLDIRSKEDVEELVKYWGGEEDFQSHVGNKPIPSTYSAGIVRWIMREENNSWNRTKKVGFLNTFLCGQLTGEWAVDPTVASFSGLVRLAEPFKWSDELRELSGIPSSKLLTILTPYTKIGEVTPQAAKETGLPTGLPVALGCADTAAASFALGLSQKGDCFESAGTSDVLTFCLDRPDFNPMFLNRSHVYPGRWLAHGAMSTPGAAIEWLITNVFPELGTVSELEKEAERSEPGARGLIFLPYLAGERSPIFDPNAKGLWLGLRLDTRRADIIRAVYEGIAFGLRQILKYAEAQWDVKIKSLPCVGGAAKSQLGLKIKADVLGLEYQTTDFQHVAALGAALLGGIAGGVYMGWEDPEIPYLKKFNSCFKPNFTNYKIYDQLFTIYERLYPSTKEAMHALNVY